MVRSPRAELRSERRTAQRVALQLGYRVESVRVRVRARARAMVGGAGIDDSGRGGVT